MQAKALLSLTLTLFLREREQDSAVRYDSRADELFAALMAAAPRE